LNAAGARYLLVGGYAVAFHAQPRFTKDLDIWTEGDAPNAARVYEALRGFGAPLHELTIADLERPGTIFQIGVPPKRIDVMTANRRSGFSRGHGSAVQKRPTVMRQCPSSVKGI
jgi:hypothetical protein